MEPGAYQVNEAAVPCPVIRKVRPPLVFTNPEPPPWGVEGLALKETFWWPSEGSAVLVHICPPMLCWVPLGVDSLGLSKQKVVPLVGLLCPEASLSHSTHSTAQGGSRAVSGTVTLTGVLLTGWHVGLEAGKSFPPMVSRPV